MGVGKGRDRGMGKGKDTGMLDTWEVEVQEQVEALAGWSVFEVEVCWLVRLVEKYQHRNNLHSHTHGSQGYHSSH